MTELAFTNSSSGVGLCVLARILAGILAIARRRGYDGSTEPDGPAGRKGIMLRNHEVRTIIAEYVAVATRHAAMAAQSTNYADRHRAIQREALLIAAAFAVTIGEKGRPVSVGAMAMTLAAENGMTVPLPQR